MRNILHAAVVSKSMLGYVRSIQTVCGVSKEGVPTNTALHLLFSLASTLGDETFYTLALPLCAWLLDLRLSRRLALFWVSTYYVGQAVKDMLQLPRPPPPVVRLEHLYSAEYGLPSTHTMGSLIPLFLAACHWNAPGAPGILPPEVLCACIAWSGLIAVSRLYKGVHSIPDVVAGYALGMVLLAFWLCFGGAADAFIVETPWAWLAVATGATTCIVMYPSPARWTNSYGDTTVIIATAAGFLEGCCLAPRWEQGISLQILEGVHLISSGRAYNYGWRSLTGDVCRCGVGFMVLLSMRFTLKCLARGIFSSLATWSPGSLGSQTARRHAVDIPTKIVVYGSMGFSACVLVPFLWLKLGLHQDAR